MKIVKVIEGLKVAYSHKDGHWLYFTVNGKCSLMNVESSAALESCKITLIEWIDKVLKESKGKEED